MWPLQRATVPSEQDFSAVKEKRAVPKADRLAAENRIADFLTGNANVLRIIDAPSRSALSLALAAF
jgi:hypothetical protein